jgi:adenylate cyclase
MMLGSTRLYLPFVILLLSVATIVRVIDPFSVYGLRLLAFDWYQRLHPQSYDPEIPVRIVDIDETSLARLGQWPWPRTAMRDLLLELTGKGAVAVGFDVLFVEPDRSSIEEIAKRLPAAQASALLQHAAEERTNDQVFADALRETPSVLGTSLAKKGLSSSFRAKAGFAVAGDDPRRFIPSFSGVSGNLAVLEAAAKGIGAINWSPDRDQVVRRVPLLYRVGGELVPSFAAELLRVAQGASTYVLKAANASGETAFGRNTGLNHLKIGDLEIPTDADGGIFIRFRPSNPAAYIPFWKVLSGEVSREEVDGRIVLVGTSAPGLLDLRATPLDSAMPGVEVHAQVLEHILAGRSLVRPDYALAMEESIIIVLGLLLATILPRVTAAWAAVSGVLTISALLFGGWLAFYTWGLLIDTTYPALALASMTGAITFYVYRGVETQRSAIRSAFAHYLAPQVIEEIIADPHKLELGGEVRELTLMFCDVRNFTSISEGLSAAELTRFINELLTPISEAILNFRGTIDKYMGDGVMAFWNAPLDDPHHADHACEAVAQIAIRIKALNQQLAQQAAAAQRPFQQVRIGIGVNTGECCVGNLGSNFRFDYSAIGDEVNLTSRLEGLTKIYGVTAVIGERTLTKAKRDFATLELDLVTVKGRIHPTRVYTLLALLGDDLDQLARLQQKHKEFLDAYRRQQWNDAECALAVCREIGIAGLETYYSLFASRITSLRSTSLPSDWDGSFLMVEK